MTNNRAFIILKSLSTEEFRWFYKFIKSPYYNANKHLVKLYELLRKHYPAFEHPRLKPKVLFKKLFPEEEFDVQRWRLLLHRFANLLEAFLVAQEMKADDFLFKKTLTKSLSRTNTYSLFEKKTEDLLARLDESPVKDEHLFQNKVEFNLQYYAHPATNRQQKGMENLLNAMESLDDYFELSKIKLACALKARQQTISSKDFNIKYLDTVLNKASTSNLLVSIYSKIIALQESKDNTRIFEDLKVLYVSNIDIIRQEDKRNILQILLNFCIRIANKGEASFIYHSLGLYKIGLEYDCLMVYNKLSETAFNNIVSSAIGCQEFAWTKSFIEQYGKYLDATVREDAITFSWALWHFAQNEFEKTIHLILSHSFTKPLQIINTKAILIRTYTELYLQNESYYELSIAQINTFEKYIRNNKVISARAAEGYLNFAWFTKKLINLKLQNKKTDSLKTKLHNTQNLILRKWILERL